MQPDLGVQVAYDLNQLSPDERTALATELTRSFPDKALVRAIAQVLAPRLDPLQKRLIIPWAKTRRERDEYGQVRRWVEQHVGAEPPRTDFMRNLANAIDVAADVATP